MEGVVGEPLTGRDVAVDRRGRLAVLTDASEAPKMQKGRR
jgi:hypothetical protein